MKYQKECIVMNKQDIIKELAKLNIWNIDKKDKASHLYSLLCIARNNKTLRINNEKQIYKMQ